MKKALFLIPVIIIAVPLVLLKISHDNSEPAAASISSSTVQVSTSQISPVQANVLSSLPAVKKETKEIRIFATGDILLGRGVKSNLQRLKKDYTYPFEKITDYFKKGDIVFGNLEESITSSERSLSGIEQVGGKYVLKNDVEAFSGIKYAGYNILNLANNHILDYYDTGLFDTLDILDKNSIKHIGAGKNIDEARKPVIIEKNGLKIGFLAYTDMADAEYKGNPPLRFEAGASKAGVAPKNIDYIKEDITKLRPSVDIIIVSLHWGIEYETTLYPGQQDFAHNIMDMGADMILGHHPHHIKGIEIYKGKPIVYSLGNFISDQNDLSNQEGFFLDITYNGGKVKSLSAIPFKIASKSQVVPVTGTNAMQLLNKINMLSAQLGSKCYIKEDKVSFDIP